MPQVIKAISLWTGRNIKLIIDNGKFVDTIKSQANEILLDDDVFVSAGWIDMHVHCDPKNKLYTSNADDIGYKQGVVMVVDGGSTGASNWKEFYKNSMNKKTIVKAFLNISKNGIYAQSELSNLADINIDIEKNDFIVGYKIRMSRSVVGKNDILPLQKFIKQKKNNLPTLVHIGNEPPYFKDYVNLLDDTFIITHVFNGKNNALFKNGKPTKTLQIAQNKGVKFDLGHGSQSFDYIFAKQINKEYFNLDTISTDIYDKNQTDRVVSSLALSMSKMKLLNYSWFEIIECVTTNPANILNIKNWNLKAGSTANATFFKLVDTNETVMDSAGNLFQLKEKIVPVAVLIKGEFIKIGD